MRPKNQPAAQAATEIGGLTLRKETCLGLQGARECLCNQLKRLITPGIPIKFQEYFDEEDGATVFLLISSGLCATLHIQPFGGQIVKGGAL